MDTIIRDYKVNVLPAIGEPNARYYVTTDEVGKIHEFVTDKYGVFYQVVSNTIASARYVHLQAVPQLVWIVNHNLGFKPVVIVTDSSDRSIITEIEHINNNTLKVNNDAVFGGKVYCA